MGGGGGVSSGVGGTRMGVGGTRGESRGSGGQGWGLGGQRRVRAEGPVKKNVLMHFRLSGRALLIGKGVKKHANFWRLRRAISFDCSNNHLILFAKVD